MRRQQTECPLLADSRRPKKKFCPLSLANRDLGRVDAMTIYDSIIAAAKIRLGMSLEDAFRPGELRQICGIAQGSFSPIFKGMRIDPGTAPAVHERARGLFVQLERGLYKLSDKGKTTIGASSAIPFASSQEVEASDSLEESGYWSATSEIDDRQRALVEVVQRKGQPIFRMRLLTAYDFRCAISGCDAVPALEAAHISPYSGSRSNVARNGLLLRADLHTLFDLKLFAIEPETLRVHLSQSLLSSSYASLHMTQLAIPAASEHRPDLAALGLRWSEFVASERGNRQI